MKKHLLAALAFIAVALAGCGNPQVVQQGEVARVIGSSGPEPEWRAPGTFRMESCGTISVCNRLVKLETNRDTRTFSIDTVYLQKSNIDLTKVDVAIQYRVRPNRAAYDRMLAEVPLTPVSGDTYTSVITTEKMWEIYARRAAPSAVVAALREYSVDQILSNVPEIEKFTLSRVQEEMKDSPVEIMDLSFDGDIGQLPAFVLEAKRQNFAVEDQKERELKMLANGLEVETQRQAVQRKRAENDVEIAKKLGTTPAQYMCLKTLERLADSSDRGVSVAVAFGCGLDGIEAGNKPVFLPGSVPQPVENKS